MSRLPHESVAKKFRSSRAKDAALVAVNPQLERLLNELDRVCQHAISCALGRNIYVAVVGVSTKLQPPFLQILVQFVEDDQGQDRAEGGPLRRSFVSGSHQPIGQNARTEVAPYETDEHLVPAVPFQHRNQSIVIDGVKEFGKVHFDNPRASFRYVALRLLDSLMCTAPGRNP